MCSFQQILENLANLSSFSTAIIAFAALVSWKKQSIGKAKMEIAGQVLCSVQEIEDLFSFVLNSSRSATENQECIEYYKLRNKQLSESDLEYVIPLYRIEKNTKKIELFFELRNKVAIYWDPNSIKAFDKIMSICKQIQNACNSLRLNKNSISEKDFILYGQIISGVKNNPIDKQLDAIFEEIRFNMSKVLKKRDKWLSKTTGLQNAK